MGNKCMCGSTEDQGPNQILSNSRVKNPQKPKIPKSYMPGQQHETICKIEVIRIFNDFLSDVDSNNRAWKSKFAEAQKLQNGIPNSLVIEQQQIAFKSMVLGYEKIFSKKLDTEYEHKLSQPYFYSFNFFREKKNLVFCVQYFLRKLELVIVDGHLIEDEDYCKRRNQFIEQEKDLYQMFDKLIELSKRNSQIVRRSTFELKDQSILQENLQLREMIEKHEKTISWLSKENDRLSDPKQSQIQVRSFRKADNQMELQTTLDSYKQKEQGYQTKISHLTVELKEKDRLISQQRVQQRQILTQQEQIIQSLTKQLAQKQLKLSNLEKMLASKQDNASELNSKIEELSKALAEAQNNQRHAASKHQEASFQVEQLSQEIEELRKLNQTKDSRQEEPMSRRRNIESSQNQSQHEKVLKELQELRQLNKQLQSRLDDFRSSKNLRRKSFVEHVTLFTGDILEKNKVEKRFLINSIEAHMLKVISKTKPLYQLKRDGKVNFHNMIDNHSNLVIIVETANKVLIAGFYSGTYGPKIRMDEEALLISLTNSQYFVLNNQRNNQKKDKKDKRPIHGMVYDNYFFILGNAEIRIRHGEKKMFSNFGVQNGYFMSKGETVNGLLGEGKKNEVAIENYEIHEVFFDDDYEYVEMS